MSVPKKWFSYDPNGDGLVCHYTKEEAIAAAEKSLEAERLAADDTWSDMVDQICWGRVMGVAVEIPDADGNDYVDYGLEDLSEKDE